MLGLQRLYPWFRANNIFTMAGTPTCLEIRTNDDRILIVDAGSGIREAGNSLIAAGRNELHSVY